MRREDLIAVARGDQPADLVLRGGRVVNVLTGEILETDIAIAGTRIAGLGPYDGREVMDLAGAYVAPGLIDAHVHIESSMVVPSRYAAAVVPRGTTSVIADPHEIANVMGVPGIQLMLDDSAGSPLSVFVMAPSCVPATHMATSGATLSAADLAPLLGHPRVLGLGEVMNFPGVVGGDPSVMAKLAAFEGRVVDGHAPGLAGRELNAYIAAGIGSDHECTTADEAREKLRLGMTVFLRQATNARNLLDLLPAVTDATRDRVCLCTDDRQPADLLGDGHIDHLVRTAIAAGCGPVAALRMATHNTAVYFGLRDRGSITPGRRADLIVFRELDAPRPHLVLSGGAVVARDGEYMTAGAADAHATPACSGAIGTGSSPEGVRAARPIEPPNSVTVDWDRVDLRVPVAGSRMRVIGVVPNQLLTTSLEREATIRNGLAIADPDRDLLKMAVIERHGLAGTVGHGFVEGLGLRRGAIATSVAHDNHNLVVVGADDECMLTAARHVAELGGGMAVADAGAVLAEVPLPLAGLMSTAPIETVRDQMEQALQAARSLGSQLHDPFMALSFLALEVIPRLKLTDQGLVDVDAFAIVPLWLD
ncbi:MAG: adenine deaminase [Anaerolineae bacterium]